MYNDITKPPPPLPTPRLQQLKPGVSLLPPLSRRGHGPGLILLTPDDRDIDTDTDGKLALALAIKKGVPSLLVKWAEEGYAVVGIQERAALAAGSGSDSASASNISTLLTTAIEALSRCEECDDHGQGKLKIGLVVYHPKLWNLVAPALSDKSEIVAAVIYATAADEASLAATTAAPVLRHLAGSFRSGSGADPGESVAVQTKRASLLPSSSSYYHPKAKTHEFAIPFQPSFDYGTEALSHTRTLSFLKPLMGGPYFDLEAIWDEHTYYEFADRSVEHTMSTMVQEPYVNHIPTMNGGIGREPLTDFYRHNFIFNNSADTETELLSRTLGIDRVVDEFLFKFTHDKMLDWLLPGVPPTHRKAEVPFTAVVNIRGDRLYHEHIAWDQGTVLVQLGLMPEYLPFPYPLPPGSTAATPGKQVQYRVPVAGVETALKMADRNSVPSNELFKYRIREV
ncbi:carboxymethylenebutenolidase [Capronia epimyces CBS 606.96]|uniref:Carboxymethylenebutenolidase n=1 Tax=Capronia epimyces CBS 606.96 TaxID=1182542 RepID=W9ZDT3_9EURO|nr:carboxymethylenebutenolidase [Capronia epimyces CBS 606.96]EXJ92684.1 carboxymethylenebutenolidase [Capronia epimyces CBS 606.96]